MEGLAVASRANAASNGAAWMGKLKSIEEAQPAEVVVTPHYRPAESGG